MCNISLTPNIPIGFRANIHFSSLELLRYGQLNTVMLTTMRLEPKIHLDEPINQYYCNYD